jgi:hypothetical protein
MKQVFCILLLIAAAFLSSCSTAPPAPSLHDKAHQAREPYVDIAVNLGLKHDRDLWRLYDCLAAAGFRCGMRAMSLGAEQIVVELADFERARAATREIIIRDKLTVRVYKSEDFAKSSATSLLEVWETGQMIREEPYKLYFD